MEDLSKKLEIIIKDYVSNIEEDIKLRWNSWEKDLLIPEMFEVIGGLMARQVTIAEKFLSCSSIWNGHIAPIIMRSLVDNYINFAWIFEDPIERSRKFIYYGLGREKLQLEHWKKEMENREATEEEKLIVKASEHWIDSQRFTFLTEVNLNSWSEISVRQMAEEANCLDLYNYVYQPFSGAAHNMWNHIARYNLIESDNPLHKFFRKPGILDDKPDFYYVDLTAKYVDKMFRLFDAKTGFIPTRKYSHQLLDEAIDNFESDVRNSKSNI